MTIITGRGKHLNPNGTRAVLFHALPKWLEQPEIKAMIQGVRRDMGAYEITLKSDREEKLLQSMREATKAAAPLLFPPKYIAFIREKAAQGRSSYQYLLGGLMLEGISTVEKNEEEGAKLIEQAANGGDSFAQMQMGILCALGKGVQQSYEKARGWHLKASEKDAQPHSLFILGEYYWVGKGVLKDDEVAIAYLRRAAELKEPFAAYNLGKIYLEGSDITKTDGALAQKYLEQAAEAGLLEAKVLAAKQHFFGWEGIPCDYEKARHWFTEAAKEGDPIAEYYLGRIFFEGLGVEKSLEVAYGWYQKSADHGDRDAGQFLACALIEEAGSPLM